MHIFMVQGAYGIGGVTFTMLRRANEFIKKGMHCYSISLDFTKDVYTFQKNNKERINKNLVFLNPFVELSNHAKNADISQFDIFKNLSIGDYEILDYMKVNDSLLSITFKKNEKNKIKLYFSENGLCIASELLNEENKSISIITYDYLKSSINVYKDFYDFRCQWLYNTVISNTAKQKIVICDGPGTAPKMSIFKGSNIKTYFIQHNRHKDDQGQLTKPTAYVFKNHDIFSKIIFLTKQQEYDVKKEYNLTNTTVISNFINESINFKNENYIKNKIGFFGSLVPNKGIKDALLILNILVKKYQMKDIVLDIYGSHEKKSFESITAEYISLAKSLEIQKNLFFHGFTKHPLEEMKKCTCILFPSYRECQPLTLLESMQVGTPVVSYDCKYGPSSIITDGIDGFLCKIQDHETMANRVFQLITNNELRSNMSKECLKINEKYNNEAIFKQWETLFNK